MKTIGFGGTFYTLWDIQVERVNIKLGAWFDKVTCTYHKNLSKNLEDAIIKAGTDNFDDTLKGKKRSFYYNKPIVLEPIVMTEREELAYILLSNDHKHLVEGVRKQAFERALELGYLSELKGDYEHREWVQVGISECGRNVIQEQKIYKSEISYKWNGEVRCNDTYFLDTLGIFITGIV
jgi:hypothetical protein